MTFAEFLLQKYLAWQQAEGSRKTVSEFADYLGYSQPTISSWLNGNRVPSDEEVVAKLAVKLGVEVYDVLGLDRPEENLFIIRRDWDNASPELRRRTREDFEKNVNEEKAKRMQRTRRPPTTAQ